MFAFSDILPFSSWSFAWFMLGAFGLMLLGKFVLKTFLNFERALALISLLYLILLFPKPAQFLGFVLYGYGLYHFFGRKLKKEGLLLPVCLHFLPLLLMKITNITPLFQEAGSLGVIGLIIQVAGMSYACFKMVQVYIDEKDNPEPVTLLRYFNFIAFTPTLLIGPIDRYQRFKKDVEGGWQQINAERIEKAFDYLLRGMAYKFVIGQAISVLILEHLSPVNAWYEVSYAYSYVFYLFFDFAGYSLLAMGFGALLGIDVPFNFNRPFAAFNPRDFWQRWHKSLGDWLNDYFFKPIFKELTTKKWSTPIRRQNIALMSTFTLMGFWNGLELHYIASGFIFGCYSAVHNYYLYSCRKNGRDVFFGNLSPRLVQLISITILFHAVTFAIFVFSGKLF